MVLLNSWIDWNTSNTLIRQRILDRTQGAMFNLSDVFFSWESAAFECVNTT